MQKLFGFLFIAVLVYTLIRIETRRYTEKREFYFCENKTSGKTTRPLSREDFRRLQDSIGSDFELSYTCEVKHFTRAEIDALFSSR